VNKRKIIIPIVLLLGGAAIAWRVFASRDSDPNRIVVHGNIELTEVDLSFKLSGRLIELAVDEGAYVKKGQILARLDKVELENQRDREVAGRTAAESNLAQLQTGIRFQKESIAGDLELKRADLRQAEARLSELLAGSRPQEIEQAQAAVSDATTQHELAKMDWERAQRLYKNDDISTAQFDQFRTRFESTRAVLKRAQDMLSLVKEGPRKEQIAAARAAVDRGRAAVRLAEANQIDLQRREQETVARRADIARSEAQVKVVDVQISDRVIYAPTDGVILSKSAEPGEVLAAGATVLTLGDIAQPYVRAYIGERDLGRVKLGQQVEATTDSYPGKKYAGSITFISSQAEFTPKQIQTADERVKLVYRTKISVANPNQELKNNMPVDAVLILGSR
jgi:HlyD family secretion protein